MRLVINPTTGSLDLVGDSAPFTSSYPYKVEKITLSASDISNKYVILSEAPTSKPLTRVVVIGGIEQDYGSDFVVTTDDANKRLSWDGLNLEDLLEIGSKLVIIYV